jgi:hypothetical protein
VHSESIDDWVSEWLRDTLPSPDVCAAACAKVLKFAGDEACARDLRAVLRKSIEERTHFPADEAVYCSVALAMIDSDEVGADNAQAQADMDLSRASTEAVYSALTDTSLSPEARHEQATNLVMLLINSAMAAVASGEVRVAADILKQIRAIVDKDYDPGSGKYARAATFVVSGLISHYEDNPRRALISWRTATLLAREIGAMEIAYVALENRWRVAWEIGEDKLARMLAEETESVSRLVPGRRPAALAELSRLHPASGGADASVEPRPARCLARQVRRPTMPADLMEAINEYTQDSGLPTNIVVTLPPELREAIRTKARQWANAGLSMHSDGDWDAASLQFFVGGAAFAMAGDREQATQAFLYVTDGWRRNGRRWRLRT